MIGAEKKACWKRIDRLSKSRKRLAQALEHLKTIEGKFTLWQAGEFLREKMSVETVLGNALTLNLRKQKKLSVAGTVGLAYWYKVC